MIVNSTFWKNRRVFLTGHTGFKGGWLSYWLKNLGAIVSGYSNDLPSNPNFLSETDLTNKIDVSTNGDIRDIDLLLKSMQTFNPEFVIHMAAQPIVSVSYKNPLDTFSSNVNGTLNVLENCRKVNTVKVIIIITSDKCYENKETDWIYSENDKLGGYDPYSSSKACAEILTNAYRESFFISKDIEVSTVRAGNVIGGGDWGKNRLLPDFFNALYSNSDLIHKVA